MAIKNITKYFIGLTLAIPIFISGVHAEEEIFQCRADRSTTFQDMPCPVGSTQENMVLEDPLNTQNVSEEIISTTAQTEVTTVTTETKAPATTVTIVTEKSEPSVNPTQQFIPNIAKPSAPTTAN